jgi:hypothetical protein
MADHRPRWLSRVLWGAFQIAIVGGVLWLRWLDRDNPDAPAVWLTVAMGVGLAFLATLIPIVIIEGARDVRRVYIPAWRRWRERRSLKRRRLLHRASSEQGEPRGDQLGAGGPGRSPRKLP